jgi:hypothetical protein
LIQAGLTGSKEALMKHAATVALMLHLSVAGVYAQQSPVKMTFSGSNVATTINLQSETVTDEEQLAGNGTLGPFTFRELHADTASPQPSSTCSDATHLYFPVVAGSGVFLFHDGSLMTVGITEGAVCVDLTAGVGHLVVAYQITGGTRRLKGASGTMTLTSTLTAVLFNASDAPALLTNTGKFEGTVLGVATEDQPTDERQ